MHFVPDVLDISGNEADNAFSGRKELTELLTKERHERKLCFPCDDMVSSLKGFFSLQRKIMFLDCDRNRLIISSCH